MFEYCFLFSIDFYFYVFYDYVWVDNCLFNNLGGSDIVLWYQGLGVGIIFEICVGFFGFSLVFGKQEDLIFDFGVFKVYFGYVSLFQWGFVGEVFFKKILFY